MRDVEDDGVGFSGSLRPIDLRTTTHGIAFEFDQISIEIVDNTVPQRGRVSANVLPVINLRDAQRPTIDKLALGFL